MSISAISRFVNLTPTASESIQKRSSEAKSPEPAAKINLSEAARSYMEEARDNRQGIIVDGNHRTNGKYGNWGSKRSNDTSITVDNNHRSTAGRFGNWGSRGADEAGVIVNNNHRASDEAGITVDHNHQSTAGRFGNWGARESDSQGIIINNNYRGSDEVGITVDHNHRGSDEVGRGYGAWGLVTEDG